MNTIYEDSERKLYVENNFLNISGKNGTRGCLLPIAFHPLTADASSALKKAGKKGEWIMIATEGLKRVEIIVPVECKAAIEQANKDFRAERALSQATLERNEVRRLYACAEAKRDYPGEYFPLLQKAEEAEKAWKEKYPEASQSERNDALKAKADELDAQSIAAESFDADGWLSPLDRKNREQELSLKATKLREKADGFNA